MEHVYPDLISHQRAPLLALIGASAISEIGSMLTFIALPWFVLQTTGSVARTGLAGFSVAVPGFLVGIFGGTLVDRLGHRHSSIVADVVSGASLALVPTLYFTVGLPFPVLMALVFLGSMLAIPGVTARRSMLPELAQLAGTRLERVNAAFESIQHIGLLFGPPVAGLLIAWQSASTVLWIDAGTFVFSAVVVSLLVPSSFDATSSEGTQQARYLSQLMEGWRFLMHDALLRDMAITVAVFNGLTAPVFAVALPVIAKREFGSATALGLMASAFAVGALTGISVYGATGHRLSRRTVWCAGYVLMPGFYWVLATHPTMPALLAVLVIEGFVTAPLNPLMVTIRHERIPTAMRGRVFATFSAITQLVSPIGILLGAFAISAVGLHSAVLALAITVQIAAVVMLFVPSLRRMDVTA